MRLYGLWFKLAISTLFAAASAQTNSGLSFDSQYVVNIVWAFESVVSTRYTFWLCAGDESTGDYDILEPVVSDMHYKSGDWVSFQVNRNLGGNDANAYFLKITPSDSKDALSGFTSHFTLTNMKGAFSSRVSAAVKAMQFIPMPAHPMDASHLLGPDEAIPSSNVSQSTLQFPTPTLDAELNRHELRKRILAVDPHTIPYGEQTGLTKYAPMPKRAGTTIADKSATPQYPPFPFSIATTYLPAPTVQYTDTAYATWTTHSIENTAAPAAMPTLNKRMQDWLERWKD